MREPRKVHTTYKRNTKYYVTEKLTTGKGLKMYTSLLHRHFDISLSNATLHICYR